MKERFLTLALAKSIAEQNPPTDEWLDCLDLSEYSRADLEAIQYLAVQGRRGCLMLGLTEIDTHMALIIANWSTTVYLTNLPCLSRKVAAILSVNWNILSIEGLRELDVDVAIELAKNESHLSISCLGSLTIEAAKALARHNHELFVKAAIQPSMDVQRALLFQYEGKEVTLRFPSDIAHTRDDIHLKWYRNMEVRSFVDDAGQLWLDVISTDDHDNWQSRQIKSDLLKRHSLILVQGDRCDEN